MQNSQSECLRYFPLLPLVTTPSWLYPSIEAEGREGRGEKGHKRLSASTAMQWCKLDQVWRRIAVLGLPTIRFLHSVSDNNWMVGRPGNKARQSMLPRMELVLFSEPSPSLVNIGIWNGNKVVRCPDAGMVVTSPLYLVLFSSLLCIFILCLSPPCIHLMSLLRMVIMLPDLPRFHFFSTSVSQ